MDLRFIHTMCPYCGVGCNLILQVLDGQIIGTLPAKTGPTNEGTLCIKRLNVHEFIQHKDRLAIPLIRRGSIMTKARVTERVRPGVVFIPMHFMENAANRLTSSALDPITKTPEYKVCAVSLGKEKKNG